VTCYIPRWFTRPQTVTHPSTNRARYRLTSLIKPTPPTTTPRRHPVTPILSFHPSIHPSVRPSVRPSVCPSVTRRRSVRLNVLTHYLYSDCRRLTPRRSSGRTPNTGTQLHHSGSALRDIDWRTMITTGGRQHHDPQIWVGVPNFTWTQNWTHNLDYCSDRQTEINNI